MGQAEAEGKKREMAERRDRERPFTNKRERERDKITMRKKSIVGPNWGSMLSEVYDVADNGIISRTSKTLVVSLAISKLWFGMFLLYYLSFSSMYHLNSLYQNI